MPVVCNWDSGLQDVISGTLSALGANVGGKEVRNLTIEAFLFICFVHWIPCKVFSKNILNNACEQTLKTLANAFMVYAFVVCCMLQSLE